MVYSDAVPGPSNPLLKSAINHASSLAHLPALPVPPNPTYRRPAPIKLSDDLLSRFGLYDAFQRQVIGHSKHQQALQSQAGLLASSSHTANQTIAPAQLGSTANQPLNIDDKEKEKEKKDRKIQKEHYKSLFKSLPGKTDTKKDRYLTELAMMPIKEGRIAPLDPQMAEAAFTIYDLGPLPGGEDEQKKRKKKRKREDLASGAPTPAPAHLPTPGGQLPPLGIHKPPTIIRASEMDMSPRPVKKPRQDPYPAPVQQPTPQG